MTTKSDVQPRSTPSGFAVVDPGLFIRNMRVLWRFDPALAHRVDAVNDDERLPLEATLSGAWTTKMSPSGGSPVYLHSRYDPEAEAEKLVAAVPIEEKYCFVISGMGLGYHVRALYRRLRGDFVLVCCEPSTPLIATALSCLDLTAVIASQRFVVLTDGDKGWLHERLQPLNSLMMLGVQFVRHPPSERIASDAHTSINRAISEFVTYTRMTLMTLVANSRRTCKNIAMNLRHYVSTPPIDILRDRFAGDPAIVIAAGPSLAKNIDQLSELRGRAVLIAVQTALKPLARRGIVPDFVTSLDFHEMSRKFFEDVGDLRQVHLVAEPKAHWHVLDHYPGPMSLLDNAWSRMVLGDALAARGGLKAGATVAHLAFYLAVYMGCDPIIFVGQDLAYTGHVFYVPGVEIHHAWRSELNRFYTMEQKEWERIARNRPILRRVVGIDGSELYTDELLFTYLEQFEKDIASTPVRVIQASEGGARIRGTEVMTLAEAQDRFCRRMVAPTRFGYRDQTHWRDPGRLEPARRELERRMEEIETAIEVCDELLRLLDELKTITHDPLRFNRRLVRVDELRTKVQQESRVYEIINMAAQLAEFRRFSADRRIGATETDDAERAKRQIARDLEFIGAFREGAEEVRAILQQAIDRFSHAVAIPT